jgi:hypothetical protein
MAFFRVCNTKLWHFSGFVIQKTGIENNLIRKNRILFLLHRARDGSGILLENGAKRNEPKDTADSPVPLGGARGARGRRQNHKGRIDIRPEEMKE